MKNATPDPDSLWDIYQQHKSVHKVGGIVGRCGDWVWKKLKSAGFKLNNSKWTSAEIDALMVEYASGITNLLELAARLGRSYESVQCKANELGITRAAGKYVRAQSTKDKMSKINRERFDTVGAFGVPAGDRAALSELAKQRIKECGHPRGFLGGHHSDQMKRNQSELAKSMWDNLSHKFNSAEHRASMSDRSTKIARTQDAATSFSRTKKGFRVDIGLSTRSSWEANYARALNRLIKSGEILSWEYESAVFEFQHNADGVRSYRPDFKVTRADGSVEFHEVKGWMTARSKAQLALMAEHHKHVTLVLVDQKVYRKIARGMAHLIPNWEYPKRRKRRP